MLIQASNFFFFFPFQGCESVYGSVSGLKSHLGTCTLVGSIPVLVFFLTS